MGEGSIAIVPSARQLIRNRDSSFPFRQDSDFHYLCGFDEPESVLVLAPGRRHGEFLLFCRERDRERENWDGLRAGPEGACELYGADDAFPIGDLDDILPGLIEGRERLYYAMGKQPEFDHQLMSWINKIRAKARTGAHPPGEFLDLDHFLHELRLYKSAEELRVMQRAGAISAAAHLRAMRACRPGMFEYQLEAELLHEFMYHGARSPAYSSIVGGGANGCIMHYVENNAALRAGDLVLIDAGCEYEHYAADVTRTFPVNGRFSAPQRALYEVVLEAQLAAIREVKPGQHWNHPHDATVRVITEGLRDLGLLDGEPRRADRARRLPHLLYAPRRALARARRARRRRLQDRRRVARAGAGHGADRGAGHLYRAGQPRCGEEVARHRHPHRGRRGGHEERVQGAHGGRTEVRARHRTADGGRGMSADSHDIVIVGGGMVGASLACALAAGGRFSRVALRRGLPVAGAQRARGVPAELRRALDRAVAEQCALPGRARVVG